MFNSKELEILTANRKNNFEKYQFFSCLKHSDDDVFFQLINVKMPTIDVLILLIYEG